MKLILPRKPNISLTISLLFCFSSTIFGQLTGTKNIPGDYATIAAAVGALNTAGGAGAGGVTFNVAANYTETITTTISLTATGTAANPIVFRKDPSTTGTDPILTAYAGGSYTPTTALQDGIWRLIGSDYITIDGFHLVDNNTSNPATMEYGFALYKASAINGCQNNSIRNCTITLNRINNDAGSAQSADGSIAINVTNAIYTAATTGITVTSAAGTNSNNKFYGNTINNCNTGISLTGYAAASPFTLADGNNDVGGSSAPTGNTIINYGGGGVLSAAVAIRTLAQYDVNISYNTINSNDGSGVTHAAALKGIWVNTAATAATTISFNTVSVKGGGTTQTVTAIENASGTTASSNTVSITNNLIINCSYSTATTGTFYGIANSGAPATLSINSNSFYENSHGGTSGLFYCINNSGAATAAININSNIIGTASNKAVTFSAADSGSQVYINNTGGAATAALSISSNSFQGISYATTAKGINTLLSNSATTFSQIISNNTFTNLSVNTTGNFTFISNSVVVPAGGTQSVNSNSISGTFTKAAGGTVTLFTNAATSASSSVTSNNNNNFSNITVTGATIIAGWVNTDAGTSTKYIQNNTFANWTAGTGAVTVISPNISGTTNATSGNIINNITGAGSVTGIATGTGNDNIYSNTIYALTTTGVFGVIGISITSGTTKNIYKNKIYNLEASVLGGTAYGISASGSTKATTTCNIYNNLIGDLRTPASSATDPVRGISVTSSKASSFINVYYNTIYLNATSTGAIFGTSGIYHTTNPTSTVANLTLRNNSITNTSVPNGSSGFTVAYRRSSNATANYNSASNNNLFYAGAPGTSRLIFYDGTNKDQTIATYKARLTPADAQSVTEDITGKFLSISGPSSSYLHMDPAKRTQLESGGVNIPGYPDDVDAGARQGNTGYAGTGTAPDIGADEFEGIKFQALSGSYNVGAGQAYTSLTKADGLFSAINSVGLTGDVTVNITSDLSEDGTNALFQWTEQGAGNYDITIQPNSATLRTISGDALAGLIRLNGADRVTFDGSYNGSGRYLSFRNTNGTGSTGTAFTLLNGATYNTIRYSNIEAAANATNGVLLFSTSSVGGNSNNLVEYCAINGTVSGISSNVCIYSAGTAANENASNTISNNTVHNYRDRGLDITSAGSTAWTVSNNSFYNGDVSAAINYAASYTLHTIRILGGTGYTVSGNYIGGSAALAAGTAAVYGSTLGALSYQGILVTTTAATPASYVKGNVIANIALATTPAATSSNAFIGIETNGSGITIGGSNAGEGNMVGSNTTNGSITVTTTTSLNTYKTTVRGINCNSSGGLVIGNQVSSLDIKNIGASPAPSNFIGIYISNAGAPSQVNNNIIGSTGTGAASSSIRVLPTSTATATTLSGITIGTAVASAVQVSGNMIQNVSHQSATASGNLTGITNTAGTTSVITIANNAFTGNSLSATAGTLYAVYNTAIPASITISNNTISSNSTTGTTPSFNAIYNTGATPLLTITNNLFTGNTTTSTAGLFYAIVNSGAVTGSININSNKIGDGTAGPIAFNAANSGSQIFIYNSAGTAAAALSISNNNFQGINYAVSGTGTNTYISNTATTLSQSINGNTFTNLNIQTTGSVTFISNSVAVSSTGTQNVNNNAISGAFTKKALGTITCLTSSATCAGGSVININSNNFSNITTSGATVINGLVNSDLGSPTKTIQNNTFTNWTGGSSAITLMSVNITGTDHYVSGNIINNITGGAAITGILTGAGTGNIFSNTINTLSTTAGAAVTGISVSTTGTTKNIYRNKIYDLQAATATGTVNGILVGGGNTVNVYNNIIGDLRTPAGSAVDPIRGISVTSAVAATSVNVYYNTIYLNAASTGTTFGTTGIYHAASATATVASLTLINNSITNLSSIRGTGLTVAYRRSVAALSNYSTASNNNLWYSGAPSATKVIFNDGTNSDQTLAAFKTRMGTRDAASITEDITTKYLSVTGSSGVYLHINEAIPSLVESGGANIPGITDDFDGQVRQGNPGYAGTGYAPDIGADEIFGIEDIAPAISYTLLSNTTSTVNRTLSGVAITDASGVNVTSGTKPRVYYKRVTDANVYADNTAATNGWKYGEATGSASPFSFVIDYSKLYGGASVTAGSIQYFVVAQDMATSANIGINSGVFATTPLSVSLTAMAFPIIGTISSYNIPFSGNYNVGSGNVYTSLTKADGIFSAINTVGLTGNVTVTVTSDLSEDGATALLQWAEQGAGNYTMRIQPDGTTLRMVSGNASSGLIRLDGAHRVTIDGSNSGSGNFLSFTNNNTAGITGAALTFINGASNNTIRNCRLEAFANATNGVILFGTTSGTGNSNNLIEYNNINATVSANNSGVAIYSGGTAGNENVSNTISNNSIYNYLYRGIDIAATGSSLWVINNNSLYNGDVATPLNYGALSTIHAIRVQGGSGYSITNNYIGGSGAQLTGTDATYNSTTGNISFYGISLTTSSATPASNIKGNSIAKIIVTPVPTAANFPVFTGIETAGAGINIGGSVTGEGNLIGSNSLNGAITVTTTTTSTLNTSVIRGIDCRSAGGVIKGNQVGGFDIRNIGASPAPSFFNGIYVNNANAPSQVNNNIIGSAGSGAMANSIRVRLTSTAANAFLSGISLGSATASAVQIDNNTIQNIGPRSTTASGSFTGIDNASSSPSAVLTITNNNIKNIISSANSTSTTAIFSGIVSGSPSTITHDTIDNISLDVSGVNAQVVGINVSGAYASTVSGNIISNLSTASTKSTASVETGTPAGSAIIGILNSTTAAGQIIDNNRLSGFNATSNAAVNVVVTGIGITSTGSGNIFSNKFGTFINLATGTDPALCHIMAANGSFNVYNNTSRISNLTNTNGIKIYGFIHASATNWNYFHNTVRVGGNSIGTALRSAAFLLSANSPVVLKNNIFFNIRTGTGTHYAVSNLSAPPAAWSSSTSDYNDFYSINPTTVAEWGNAANKTFAQWQSLSGGDEHSISNAISFITSTYDLEPDSITNCNFNNTGTPVTTPIVINTDVNNNPRSPATPDLGAYEFNYTGFAIIAGSDSPVCSGDSLTLSADPGEALDPSFSWTNPANMVISTEQNPIVTPIAGRYKVVVTDVNGCSVTDSTIVAINARPTATIASVTSLCDSGSVSLNISVTGTGLITGTLSNGDTFSGTAPLIVVPVYVTATTAFSISALTDGSCTAIPVDMPDTVTVMVTHKGDWLGITPNWNDAVNWCGGILPTSSTNVTIPTGTAMMPVITSSVSCNSLTINTGDTLTITGTGTLNIAGTLTNYGMYKDNGTTAFNGTSGGQTFSGVTTFNNLTLNNTSSLLLSVSVVVKNNLTLSAGTLNANNFSVSLAGSWTNNASLTAFTPGNGTVTFNGTTAQFISGSFATAFNNLTLSNTGSNVSLNVNASIAGNLLVSGGTFNLGAFTTNRTTAGGILTVANNAILKIGGTNTFPVNFAINNLVVASTVEYSGTNQVVASQDYGNLTFSSSGGAAIKTLPATRLYVVGNLTSTLGAGTSVSFTAASTIIVNGNVSIGASTTFNGGSYTDSIGGNWVNNGTFNGNTGKVTFTGTGDAISGSGAQNFNHLTVAASGVTFSADTIKLTGNLATTASGSFSQASGGTLVMSGSGTTISGLGISLNNLAVSGSVTTSASFTLTGNLSVSGSFLSSTGTIIMSGNAKTISGAGSIIFTTLNITGSSTTASNFRINTALIVDGSFSAPAGTATFTGTSALSGTANLYSVILNGTSLKLSSGAVLGIANGLTITSGDLDVTTSGPNTVNFNGTGAQNVNGITYSNLILSNGNIKTAVGTITTAHDITIATGTTFNPSSYTHSVYGNWINNGTFSAGTSTIAFRGPANGYISGTTVFNILTINVADEETAIALYNNISAAIVNMTNGILLTGSDTITITQTRTGNGFIRGNIRRTHPFTTGVAYAFEGPENTITFSAVAAVSTVIVTIEEKSISDFPFGGSAGRVYDIHVPSGTYTATLRLHYEDDELNGNDEASMGLWHYNGLSWEAVGKADNDTASNYVEQSGLTDITNRWTFSSTHNVVQWNGSVSSDWNTAANWTVIEGAGSRPPSSSDIVDLGTAAFVNQPTISSNVTVKNLTFGSVQSVTLTLGSGSSLTTLGDVNGDWTGNATHTINVNDQNLTVNGGLELSDGIAGHAINLNIGSGTVTTLLDLTEAGGANIHFSGAGTLNIYENFNYGSGTFTAGSGTVTYDGTANQTVANISYNHLVISKAGGIATINDSVTIAGDLHILSGELDNHSTIVTAGSVIIDSLGSLYNNGVFHVRGNWTNHGTYIANGARIYFDGSGAQAISASAFNNLNIVKPSGTATLTGDVTVTGDFNIISGTFDFQTYNVTRITAGGTTTIADGAVALIGGNNGPVNFGTKTISQNSTLIYNGTGAQYISLDGTSLGNVIFRNGGSNGKLLITPASIRGDLTIENGAALNGSTYTISLAGNWTNNGTFIPSASNVILSGLLKTITGPTTFYRSSVTGTYSVLSDLTYNKLMEVTPTGSLKSLLATPTTVTVNGDLINSGVIITNGTGTFTGNVVQTISLINAVSTIISTVNFNGSVSPVLNSTSAVQFNYLNINNTGGINPSVGWTILEAFTIAGGASFNAGTSTHTIYGALTNNGTITSTGTLNFIPSSAKTLNLGAAFSSTGTVVFGGAGAITLAGTPLSFHDVVISNTNSAGITPLSGWNITNDFTINSGSLLNAGSNSYLVGDDIFNSGTINSGTSTFTLNGSGTQEIYTLSPFNNLTINKASGAVTLTSNTTVNDVLNFVAGKIQTGSNLLAQPSSGTVTGAGQNTGWVAGKLQKYIATGATAKKFEVGDTASYTPVALLFSNVTAAGSLTAFTTAGDHPALGSSPINSSKSVNRFWTLTNSGVGFTNYSATYNFVAADVDAGVDTSAFGVGLYNGSSWVMPLTALPRATSIRATGITAFGVSSIGEVCYAGTTISYPASPYCSGAGTVAVTRAGTGGGTYSSATGLSINAGTGAINTAASPAGTYTITYTIAATGGCRQYTTTANITITTQPFANGYYVGNPYCSNGGIAYPTGSSAGASGTLSSTAGLSIDPSNGVVNLALSTPGNYTITYTVPASGGCALYTNTSTIAITPAPSATISYAESPSCSGAGTLAVTRSGTGGGTYSSTTGLSIDAGTGAINTATSTAGTYTVVYKVAAANGCSQYTTTTPVTITALPSAVISYSGSPFCNLPGAAAATHTGTDGGIYSSTTGLTIDASNGEINTGISAPGTYTVIYTIAPANGCGLYTTTATVTITVPGTWTGAVSNVWDVPENWLCNAVPISITNVTIPTGLSVYPVISSETITVNDLTLQPGASLTLMNATLQIAGTIANSGGTFRATAGTLEMNGSSPQIIPAATFFANRVASLVINNNAGVTLGGALTITDALTVAGGSLATNDFLTLRSNATATARVAQITSAAVTPISGNVIVERYVPGRRRYRLITSPVTTSPSAVLSPGQEGLSIWGAWQNGGSNATANRGTIITGGTTANGFDQQTNNASLYTYNDATKLFVPFSSANGKNTKYTPLKAGIAYYMFVYGDRTNTITTASPNSTVLTSKGTLLTGDQTYTTTSAIPLSGVSGKFTLLGNPFASPINWATMSKTNLENTYWGWDPNLSGTGGYITVTSLGNVILQAPYSGNTGLNQHIQSGQGFFVKTSGPSPVLTIREQDKESTFNSNAFRTQREVSDVSLLAVNLHYMNGDNKILADGVLAAFEAGFANATDAEDAVKMESSSENIAILNDATPLSIDARQLPQGSDTLFLATSRLTRPQYILQIFGQQMEGSTVQAYLDDRYLNTHQPLSLSDTNNIVFNILPGIPASSAANRFRIVFQPVLIALPVTYTLVKGTRKDAKVQIDWQVAGERDIKKYEIERSADGIVFSKTGETTAKGNNSSEAYSWLDAAPLTGNNYYRVRAIETGGGSRLSPMVLVKMETVKWVIKVFPNPVVGGQFTVSSPELERGEYRLVLYNQQGQRVMERSIHLGGGLKEVIHFDQLLAAGTYYLEITKQNQTVQQTILIE